MHSFYIFKCDLSVPHTVCPKYFMSIKENRTDPSVYGLTEALVSEYLIGFVGRWRVSVNVAKNHHVIRMYSNSLTL